MVVDAVLFVEAELLETSLPELGGLVVVADGVESGACAEEGVGEKEGRREKRKRKSVYKIFMAPEKKENEVLWCQQHPPARKTRAPPLLVSLSCALYIYAYIYAFLRS